MKIRFAASLLFFVFAALTPRQAPAEEPSLAHSKLAKRDWSVNASPSLIKKPPSKKETERFVAAIEDAITGDSELGVKGGVYIRSFRFADLRHDGFLSLLVELAVVDRPPRGEMEIIDRTPSGFELYDAILGDPEDLRHDGKLELVADEGLAEFPQTCQASWSTIYEWTGTGYTNVSDQFKDVYKKRLDHLRRIIPSLPLTPGPDGYSVQEKECLQAETSALERFLGFSTDAGIDQALRLAKSDDRLARQFGTELLLQIRTPEARKYLEKLTTDSDSGVRLYAKSGLEQLAKQNGPVKYGPDTLRLEGSVHL